MDRELVLAVLILALAGPALVVAAAWPQRSTPSVCAVQWERACWRSLWLPVAVGLVVVSALLGWAMLEPDNAERLPRSILAIGVLFGGLWARAVSRAVRSLRRRRPNVPAATVGLWHPRCVVSDDLVARLDCDAIDAVRTHEEAHARHRDPLRVWLAQLATDLQWPSRSARQRFDHWRRVLELARDEEARHRGADGPDLAAAILVAARLRTASLTTMGLIGDSTGLEDRIGRLLAPLPADEPARTVSPVLVLLPACLLSVVLGARFGEAVMQMIMRALL